MAAKNFMFAVCLIRSLLNRNSCPLLELFVSACFLAATDACSWIFFFLNIASSNKPACPGLADTATSTEWTHVPRQILPNKIKKRKESLEFARHRAKSPRVNGTAKKCEVAVRMLMCLKVFFTHENRTGTVDTVKHC